MKSQIVYDKWKADCNKPHHWRQAARRQVLDQEKHPDSSHIISYQPCISRVIPYNPISTLHNVTIHSKCAAAVGSQSKTLSLCRNWWYFETYDILGWHLHLISMLSFSWETQIRGNKCVLHSQALNLASLLKHGKLPHKTWTFWNFGKYDYPFYPCFLFPAPQPNELDFNVAQPLLCLATLVYFVLWAILF